MKTLVAILFVAVVFLNGCYKEPVLETIDLHYDYFPVETARWTAYKVDSIAYNDFTGTVDTFQFYVKELVESEFIDNEGRVNQRIERYYKDSLNAPWKINNVWFSCRIAQRAERVENNIRYIKLVFPIAPKKKWDGNAYNFLQPLEYEYVDVHKAFDLTTQILDSTLTVVHEEELTLFTDKLSFEVYAKHIGCIYKHKRNITKLADGTIVSGYNYTYEAYQWGN